MRFILIGLLFLLSLAHAQNIAFSSPQALTTVEQGDFSHPFVSPAGRIFFTQPNYKGLYYLNSEGEVFTLTEERGAGYDAAFSGDGSALYYRTYKYQGPRRFFSMYRYDLATAQKETVFENEREAGRLQPVQEGGMVLLQNGTRRVLEQPGETNAAFAWIDDSKIVVSHDGAESALAPRGEGHYIWPSVSPDGTKLLFTKAGEGTYISDLDGNILVDLGYANAPRWSADGNWIIYMKDHDDGHRLLASDIFVTAASGAKTIAVTQTEDQIELYPYWSPLNDFIVFGTESGVIYKIEIVKE